MLVPDKTDPNYTAEKKRQESEIAASVKAAVPGEKFVQTSFGAVAVNQPSK